MLKLSEKLQKIFYFLVSVNVFDLHNLHIGVFIHVSKNKTSTFPLLNNI